MDAVVTTTSAVAGAAFRIFPRFPRRSKTTRRSSCTPNTSARCSSSSSTSAGESRGGARTSAHGDGTAQGWDRAPEGRRGAAAAAVPAARRLLRVLSARVPALRTEPRRASVPAAAAATAVPEPSLRRVSGVGPEDDLGPAGRGGGRYDPGPSVRSRVARARPRPPTRASPLSKRALRRSPIASFQDERAERARAHARGGIAPGRRRRGRGSRSRGGRRWQRILGGERQRVRYSDSYYSDDDSYYSDDSRERATGSRAGRSSRHGSGDDGSAGPMDLKDSPARLVAAVRGPRTLARRLRRAVRARGPPEPSSHDRAGAARHKWRARVSLRGVAVTAATKLVLELRRATARSKRRVPAAAARSREVAAWAHIPVLGADGEPPAGCRRRCCNCC